MKKLFVSILALAAFAACQSNFNDVDFDAPQAGSVNVGGSHTIYAEVGLGEETKATYGDDLSALWEENDQIALLQEHADYGKTFGVVNKIAIKNGVGTSFASFSGDISVDATTPRIYHIVYPASAAEFNVSSALSQTSETTYTMREDGLEVAHYIATATFNYTYNSTLNVTVPAAQSGKWEPYMYASTDEAVASTAIGAKTLNTLTGAIAIRAYEADGTTPKQLKSVAVTATKPIAGTFSGSATSVGSLGSVTGPETSDVYSTISENDIVWYKGAKKGRAEADRLLLEKVQGVEPTSTVATKALSLAFVGDQYTVGAEDTSSIAADDNGVYTYHLNVAPFEGADLTVMATAVDGSTLIRTISAQSIAASHRKGYVFTWENATLTVGDIESWYNDYSKSNFTLAGNTLYVRNIKVEGVPAENVLSLGVVVNNELKAAQKEVLSIDNVEIELANGQYTAYAYAKVLVNGQEKELLGSVVSKTVTSKPTLTNYSVRTSYSSNGDVKKDNSVGGRSLEVAASLSDNYFVNNGLVSSFGVYNGNSKIGDVTNGKWSNSNAALGQYDCYVKLVFTNGYTIETKRFNTYVTGIPYSFQFYQSSDSAVDAAGWKRNGTVKIKESLLTLKEGGLAGSDSGWVASPAYYIPTGLTAKVTLQSKYYTAAVRPSSQKASIYVGATTSQTSSSSAAQTITISGSNNTSSDQSWNTNSVNVSMSNGTQYVSINHNNATYYLGSRIYVASYKIEY